MNDRTPCKVTEMVSVVSRYDEVLANARAEGYAAGQKDMQRRAEDAIDRHHDASGSRYIANLLIIEEPKP